MQLFQKGAGIGTHCCANTRGCVIMDFLDHPGAFTCRPGTTEVVRVAPMGDLLIGKTIFGQSRQLFKYSFSDGI